jgi:hypothetical protein
MTIRVLVIRFGLSGLSRSRFLAGRTTPDCGLEGKLSLKRKIVNGTYDDWHTKHAFAQNRRPEPPGIRRFHRTTE